MPNLWDRPDISEGDQDPQLTFAAVGRVLSAWEYMEFQFALLYSIFRGKAGMTTSIQEYGTGSIFALRMQSLIEKAELYFCTHPNQEIEGEFSELVDIAKKLSERRNEIAHGIVNPMVDSSSIQNVEFRYYLLTPMYAVMKKSTANFYNYSSVALAIIERRFQEFNERLIQFVVRISPLPSH